MRYYSTQRPIGRGRSQNRKGMQSRKFSTSTARLTARRWAGRLGATSSTNSPSTHRLQRTTSSSRTVLAAQAASMRRPAETWTAAGIAAAIRAESRETSTGTVGQGGSDMQNAGLIREVRGVMTRFELLTEEIVAACTQDGLT